MLIGSATPAGAATNFWQDGGTALWADDANWSLTLKPGAADDVMFVTPVPATGSLITVDVGSAAKSLTFRDVYTLTGGDLTLGAPGLITVAPGLGGPVTIESTLAGAGGITLAATNGLAGGDAQVGGGTLVLGGANTYSGVTGINAGVLSISGANNLGNAAATNTIALGGGGTLRSTGVDVDLGATRAIVLNTGGGILDVTGANVLTASGIISGVAANGFTKSGTGTLVLTNANTYAGVTTIGGGTLQIGNGGTTGTLGTGAVTNNGVLAFNRSNALTVSNVISGSGNVTQLGSGALTLSGANAHTGGTTVSAGTLLVGNAAALGTGTIALNGGTLASSSGTGYTFTNAVTVGGDVNLGQAATGTGALTFNGGVNLGGAPRQVTVNSPAATFGGIVSNGELVKAGTGVLTLGGANTFSKLTVNGGLVGFVNDGHLGAGATVFLNGGGLRYGGAGTLDVGGTRVFDVSVGGGTIDVPTGRILINDANQITGGGLVTKTGAQVLQLSATSNATGGFNIAGGTVELGNVDGMGSGAVTISGGDLATGLNYNRALTISGGGISSFGANATFSGNINATGNFNIGLRDFSTTGNGRGMTISGNLSGSGNGTILANTASGTPAQTLLLSGNNTAYTGRITAPTNQVVQFSNRQAITGVTLTGGTVFAPLANVTDAVASMGENGLNATYYNFAGDQGTALVASGRFGVDQLYTTPRAFSRVDATINIPVPTGATGSFPILPMPGMQQSGNAGTNNGAMWKGLLHITEGGSYTFNMPTDDGSALYIDGNLFINNDGGHAPPGPNPTGTITLGAGAHSIVMRWANGGGGGGAQLFYSGADTSNQSVLVGSTPGQVTTGSLAALALAPITAQSGTGTVNIGSDSTTPTLGMGNNATIQVVSGTVSNLTVTGATTLNGGAASFNANTGSLTLAGAIGQSVASNVNVNGQYLVTFGNTNTYTGLTTVSSGQLVLGAAGGNSIPGNLTVNAANSAGLIRNVVYAANDQVANTSAVTMTAGYLDMGTFSDTIGSLTMTGGTILGSANSALTVTNLSSSSLAGGTINVGLGGTGGFNKSAATLLTLAGNNTYTGVTAIGATGLLRAAHDGALGAGGAGNGTTVTAGGQLQLVGGINLADEGMAIAGAGLLDTGAIRNLAGVNAIGGAVGTTGATTVHSDGGRLTFNGLVTAGGDLTFGGAGDVKLAGGIDLGANAIVKRGSGTLIFGTDQAAFPVAEANFQGGAIGFSGPQSFGAYAIPANRGLRFDSDPGAGVEITSGATNTVIAGYAPDAALISRITASSTGTLALAVDSGGAIDLSAGPNLSLGAHGGPVTFSGDLTANAAAGYQLGGGNGQLTVTSVLGGNNALTVNGDVKLTANNTFTGGVTVKSGGTARIFSNGALGSLSNGVTLDGGTLQVLHTSNNAGALFATLGNPVSGGSRTVTVGSAGGTLDVPAWHQGNPLTGGGVGLTLVGTNVLTGSGALTKTGLGFLLLSGANNYAGDLVVAANGYQVDVRSNGTLANVASVTLNTATSLNLNNENNLGQGRQIPTVNVADRLNNAAAVTLQGGRLMLVARNQGFNLTGNAETVGTVNVGVGQSEIRSERAGGGGADLTVTNLARAAGGGVVRFTAGGTIGQSGDSGRIVLSAVNGAAPTPGALIGGWALVNSDNFATYAAQGAAGGAGGVGNFGGAGFAAYATTLASGNVANINASITLPAGGGVTNALRLSQGGGQTVAFTAATDTLFIESGGLLADGQNQNRTIGATALRGQLTAGPSTNNAAARELFLLNNSGNSFLINSVIVDNNGQAVSVVKALDGLVTLNAANTYSGGTQVLRGTMTVDATGGLGTGAVFVKNATLNLGNKGATSSTAGFTTVDGAQIVLTNNTNGAAGMYDQAGDRFNIVGGSVIYANSPGANAGLNSLTRVSAFTGGGQVILAENAVVKHNMTNAADQGAGALTIKNLGANADLFFGPGNAGGENQTLTVGSGTAWKGLSSDRGNATWTQGTLYANSDFHLQGLVRDGSYSTLSLGQAGSAGTYSIVNNAGRPINAYVTGQVTLDEESPVSLPSGLTFVVTPGAILAPNRSLSLGFNAANRAKVLVQAGGTLDPAGFVGAGLVYNQDTATLQNLVYPVASPLTGSVTVEAGGRFLINDASGVGSAQPGSWTMKSDSVLHLATTNAFFGRGNMPFGGAFDTTGVINAGQFVYEPSAVVRVEADNVYKLSESVSNATNGERVVLEMFGANRSLTNQVNPFLKPGIGIALASPETVKLGGGGMLTNDASDRQATEGRGRLALTDGAVFAATTQTNLNVNENWSLAAGATLTIGSSRTIDGLQKLGTVHLNGANSNTAGAGATISVVDGAQLSTGAANVLPDNVGIHLPAAVTAFPSAGSAVPMLGNGSSLLLNLTNFAEIVGTVTGSGAVVSNQGGAYLGLGGGGVADYSTAVVFKSALGQQANLYKVGDNKVTLTGVSDSTGVMIVAQGELELSGAGKTAFGDNKLVKGGTLTLNNGGGVLADRLGGSAKGVGPAGGTLRLIGNADAAVTETVGTLFNSVGNAGPFVTNAAYSYVNVEPAGAAATTLAVTTFENFQSAGVAGQRSGTWVLRSASVGNLPGSYTAAGAYVPRAGNLANGLITVANPNFISNNAFGVQAASNLFGQAGTATAASRPDLLGDTGLAGQGVGFMTQDTAAAGLRLLAASEYTGTFFDNVNQTLNVKLAGANATAGDTRVQTLTMTPGSSLDVGGAVPLTSTPSRMHVNSGGVFVQGGGAAATIAGGGANNFLQANGGASLFLHTQGDLNLNAAVFTDNAVVKTNAGTLNVGAGALSAIRGSFQVDAGTVNLAANNTFGNIRAQGGFTPGGSLFVNGGTLNLNGNGQFVNLLNSANALANTGGTVTSASAATITVAGGGAFGGTLAGAVGLDKVGNNTLLLTSTNSHTGNTLVRAGTLHLRDQGTLGGSQLVDVNYATLLLDNGYLGNVANRVSPTATVNLRGGTVSVTGAAAQVATQTFDKLNLLAGRNDLTSNAGGSGANVVTVNDLGRLANSGAVVNFNQGFGFLGTAGNDTSAQRWMINKLNGADVTLNDGLIGGWAVMNGDHFATYSAATGVSYVSNVSDGYANYDATDLSAATTLSTHNVSDAGNRTLAAAKTVNSLRLVLNNAAQTINLGGFGLTIDSGGILHNSNNSVTFSGAAGSSLTSNADGLYVWVNQVQTTNVNVPVVGGIDFVKSGGGTVTLAGANTFTGTTFANSGTLNLSLAGANGSTLVSVPGDLVVNNATVTETVANQLKPTANVTVTGGGRFNLVDAAGVSETLNSLTFADAAGAGTTLTGIDRIGSRPTSLVTLAAATAITSNNTNPNTFPFVGANTGMIAFSNAAGATLQVDAPAPATSSGLAAVGLRVDAQIAAVPAGVTDGGLIKAGNGILVLNPTNTVSVAASTTVAGSTTVTTTNNPIAAGMTVGMPVTGTGILTGTVLTAVTTTGYTLSAPATAAGTVTVTGQLLNFNGVGLTNDGTLSTQAAVFNVASGIVRADQNGALGSPSALTTVQDGAVLLGSNTAGVALVGSIRLKDGASLGATINSTAFGALSTSALNQSILDVAGGGPKGATVYVADYFVQSTNAATVTVNGRLTGSGNINLVGPRLTGAAGTFALVNPIVSGTGANDYSGTITVNPNTILLNQPNRLSNVGATGSALGAATINLAGGTLQLRDDLNAAATATNTSVTYNNTVNLSANSAVSVDRGSGTVAAGNTINVAALNFGAGSPVLNVQANANTYAFGVNSLAGSGTLVKAGQGQLKINGYAENFNGSLTIAGPSGRAVGHTFSTNSFNNVDFVPGTNAFQNFTVNGLYTTQAGKTFNVANAFTVGANPGNLSGMVAVRNDTTITADVFQNDGQVGATNGAATITAANFRGAGLYQTNGQPLTLAGNFGGGASLRVAGNNVVTVSGDTIAPNFTTVHSGTLRVAPATAAGTAMSGTTHVSASPAMTVAANGAPVAAVAGVLNFDGGANAVTHDGAITNSGVVRVSSGSATVAGRITGTGVQYTAGLLEGAVTGQSALDSGPTRPANPGNFGVRLEPRMFQTNAVTQNALTGHFDNELWVYTGYVKDDDGVFSFAQNVDDRAAIWIDGQLVLNAANGGTSRVISTAYAVGQQGNSTTPTTGAAGNMGTPKQNFGPGISLPGKGDGWHLIELRFNNGTGGSGPIVGNGFAANYGLGYKNGIGALDGADYVKPIDSGEGDLFVTPVGGNGNIDLLGGTTLTADGFSFIGTVGMAASAAGAGTTFSLATPALPNDAAALAVTGASGTATFAQLVGGGTTFGTVSTSAGSRLVLSGGLVTIGTGLTMNGAVDATGSFVTANVAGTGTGVLTLNGGGIWSTDLIADGGTASGIGSGAGSSTLVFNGGTLRYTGADDATTDRGFTVDNVNGGTIHVSGGAVTLDFSGAASASAGTTAALTKTGDGTLVLSGTTDNVALSPVVTGGTLVLAKASTASVHAAATNVTVNGGTLRLGGTGGDQIYTLTDTVMNGGHFDLNGRSEGFRTLAGQAGRVTNEAAATTATLTVGENNGTGTTFRGPIEDGQTGGVTAITKAGTGTWTLTSINSYSGLTDLTGGTLQLGDGGTTGSAGVGTLRVAAGATLAIDRSNAPTFVNAIDLPGATGAGTFTVAAGQTATLSGQITSAGQEFWKAGPGTLVVTNVNSAYNASNVVVGGVLEATSLSNAGSPGALGVGGIFVQDAAFRYSGATATTDQLGAFALQGAGTNSTIDVANAATVLTVASPLGNDAAGKGFTKTGPGTLAVTGTSTYDGATVINGGTLQVGNGGTTGTLGSGPVVNNAAIKFDRSDAAPAIANAISGTGSVAQSGTGQTTLSGTNTYAGATTVDAGTLTVSGSIAGSSGVTIAEAAVFEAAGAQTVKALNVGNGLATVTGPLKALTVGDGTTATPLAITATGKVDLNGNGLIVNYGTGQTNDAIVSVRDQIVRAYNASAIGAADGVWDGFGITSSMAVATPGNRAIGYGNAAEIFVLNPQTAGTFLGTAGVDDTSVLVRLTLPGDATLDGTVNFDDLLALAQSYNQDVSQTTENWWANGDFTYDGQVNFDDLLKLAQNYNQTLPTEIPGAPVNFDSDLAAAFAQVPEPGTLSLVALGALGLLRRRNRR